MVLVAVAVEVMSGELRPANSLSVTATQFGW